MPSLKDLKKRIGTVRNTQQTTKAMKMVSAAKLRRAQDAITAQRPYAKRIRTLIRVLSNVVGGEFQSSLDLKREEFEKTERRRVTLVLVTSDRGLCGAFNANIIKAAQRWLAANGANYGSIELMFVGKRGYDFFKTKKVNASTYFSEVGGKVSFVKAKKLSVALVDHYVSGKTDEIKIIYNEFKNAVTQKMVVEDYLPLSGGEEGTPEENAETSSVYIVKPSAGAVLEALISKSFAIQAFRILLESQASEHGARMSAMDNATRNAGEMIKRLTLSYNKQRQAGITKELMEIISGSESQKS